jgi:hypothetical protein
VKRSEELTVFATFLTIAGADSFYGTEEKVGCFMHRYKPRWDHDVVVRLTVIKCLCGDATYTSSDSIVEDQTELVL